MAFYNPTANMGALQLALMGGRGMMPNKVQQEAPNAQTGLARAMMQGGRRITGFGEQDPKSGQMVAQSGEQQPVAMQDVQRSEYLADSLMAGQDPNPQSDLSGAANVARILGSALLQRRADNQQERVEQTGQNELRKAMALSMGQSNAGPQAEGIAGNIGAADKTPGQERMTRSQTMQNFALNAQSPQVQEFAMNAVGDMRQQEQEQARLAQQAAIVGMDPNQFAALPEGTRTELLTRQVLPEPEEPIRGVNINGRLVNPVTGEQIGDFRTDEQRGRNGSGEDGTIIRLSAEQMSRIAPNVAGLRTAQRQLAELEAQGVTFTSGGPRNMAATAIGGLPGLGGAERVLGTDERDSLQRAVSQYEAAVLPILSGAAVTDSEAQRYIRSALPQPGDSARVRTLKAIAREQQLRVWEAAVAGEPVNLQALDQMALEVEQAMAGENEPQDQSGSGPVGANELPNASELPDGTTAIDNQTGETFVVRNGQWEPQ